MAINGQSYTAAAGQNPMCAHIDSAKWGSEKRNSRPWRRPVREPSCRRGDLNPHEPKFTSPSSWRVCLFRHFDVVSYEGYRSRVIAPTGN